MSKTKFIPTVVIAAATVAVVAISSNCGGNNENGSIRVSGNIEMTEVKVSFKTSGKLVERAVGEGDPVSERHGGGAAGPRAVAAIQGSS